MNRRRRLTKLASALCTLLLLSVAAQKSAYAAASFSDFSFGSGTPFGGNTVLAGVGVTLSSTGTAPFGSTGFLNTSSSAQVQFTFSQPITEFHLDVFAVRADEFLTAFSIGNPTSLSGTLVNQGGLITTSLPFPDDSGSGRLSWVGLNTTSITFTFGSSSGSALGISQFGLMPVPHAGACQIVVCNGLNYTGDCLVLSEGIHDFPALDAIGNDQAQSILVGPGTIAELWQDFTPYGGMGDPENPGAHATFTADDPDLNDTAVAGLVSSAAVFCDADGDGVRDDQDACPNSNTSTAVVIDGCDSGVSNILSPSGCSISDLVTKCAEGVRNHGGFVSCVAHLTNDLRNAGIITGAQKGAIQRCAAHADIP